MSEDVTPAEAVETAPAAPVAPPTPPPYTTSRGREWLAEKDRTMNLQGRAYLQVADRVNAFRLDHPTWGIITEIVEGSLKEKYIIWLATVRDDNDRIIATGRKMETPPENSRGCQDWYEKGETGAIGRALGNCGYSTVAALEEDPDRPCDAPRDRGPQRPNPVTQSRPPQPAPRPAAAPPAAAPPAAKAPAAPAAPAPDCVVCGKPVDNVGRVKWCQTKGLAPSHSEPACSQDEKAKTPAQKGE
jgi:hypothetical protein